MDRVVHGSSSGQESLLQWCDSFHLARSPHTVVFSEFRFQGWDQASPDTHRNVRLPFPLRSIPGTECNDITVEELIITGGGHCTELFFPSVSWMLKWANHQMILLNRNLNLGAKA